VGEYAHPTLPALLHLPGYGAVAREGQGTADESLLVVRCGEFWGHYHLDQGSFWWWCRGRLICADSELGDGRLKFAHEGHSVLGYPGRIPMQYFDRVPYQVDQCQRLDDVVTIRCRIPVHSWQIAPLRDQPIPVDRRPLDVRTFQWRAPDHLRIVDEPANSPDGKVTWTLHVRDLHRRRQPRRPGHRGNAGGAARIH
ncbi:MAG TPA: hypothetical protein VIL86_11145, partial [Tepidisphaeraceae bacterium]